ncbi:MAG: ribose 5-phosphate isomerase B [Firmicutes bacterium]|nr:ribose 5-phosphate isomerase B [Bacillota bacterium]
MRVAIGSDHAGFEMKESLKEYVKSLGHEVEDFGAPSCDPVDYPDIGYRVARDVASGRFDRGVLICGTGIGMSIVANKVPGVRAALVGDVATARLAREHNDANVLTLGARIIRLELAREIVRVFLETGFAGGRHARRLEKIALGEAGRGK